MPDLTTGIDSPVNMASLNIAYPSSNIASQGIVIPSLISILSPGTNSVEEIYSISSLI